MTRDLSSEPPPILAAVREFVAREVEPAASGLEHADAYPHALVERMRGLGLFGALVSREYGGLGLDVTTYAQVIEEICRGWMSLAGVINSHTMAALIVLQHGTEEQRARFLPRFARGEARGGLCLRGRPGGARRRPARGRSGGRRGGAGGRPGGGGTCNAILPGMIAAELVTALPAEIRDNLLAATPARRLGETAEVGHLI